MRRAGVICGVNDPIKEAMDPQRETATTVVLIERPPTPPQIDENGNVIEVKKKKSKKKSFFTVDLKRFRNVEEMKGEKIGERGGRALGRDLMAGVCPRLRKIDLAWNVMKFNGTQMLIDAFAKGCGTKVTWLDLRANHIDSRGIERLRMAMEKGALPNLNHLDLRQNSFGDEGGKILSHMTLAGAFVKVSYLRMDNCQIRDGGLRAIIMAMSSKSLKTDLMPDVDFVGIKNNHPSTALIKSFKLLPPFLCI